MVRTIVLCLSDQPGFAETVKKMDLLAATFPGMEVSAASMPTGIEAAMGTALGIHPAWNKNSFPTDIIKLKPYTRLTNKKAI